MEHESDGDTNCNWSARCSHQRFRSGTRGLGNTRKSGKHPNHDTIENGQNSEKISRDLKRLAVTQSPVKDHLLKVM